MRNLFERHIQEKVCRAQRVRTSPDPEREERVLQSETGPFREVGKSSPVFLTHFQLLSSRSQVQRGILDAKSALKSEKTVALYKQLTTINKCYNKSDSQLRETVSKESFIRFNSCHYTVAYDDFTESLNYIVS